MDEPTLQERTEFLYEMLKLQLWFCRRWLADHPDEDLRHVVRRRIDVFRWTDLYDGRPVNEIDFDTAEWLALEDRLGDLYEQTIGEGDSGRFETGGLSLLGDRIAAYARRRFAEGWYTGVRKSFPYGSLRFDPPKPDRPRVVGLHIANVISPRSIFDDPAYLPGCLREVMTRARDTFGADSLTTTTWLNSDPRWQALFGSEWMRNMGPPLQDVGWGKGWWGQFINARGLFNHKRGDRFRRTGRFPYPPRGSWRRFETLQQHLATLPTRAG